MLMFAIEESIHLEEILDNFRKWCQMIEEWRIAIFGKAKLFDTIHEKPYNRITVKENINSMDHFSPSES